MTQDMEEGISEAASEETADLENAADDSSSGSTVMPWLVPVLMVAAFFAFVILLALFLL